ncbi:MAG: ribosomal protein L11 methyltransferase [Beggiatoa sp. IS2]|nr:MAG: ribosomal protein L11 methyltransferase [Beggiatoa sp. IS2]
MSWLQLIFDTHAPQAANLAEGLTAVGAVAVSFADAGLQPVYEPAVNTTPLWEQTRVIGLFTDKTDLINLQAQLQKVLAPLPVPTYRVEKLADQDWSQVWMADFQPLLFGKRLWVCPSHCSPPDLEAITIFLDPGLAFGTGTHPTTALCLQWLDQQADLSGKTFIDYGCGSGILAIAAAKLGAKTVWAIDHDPQALLATQENAKKNGVANQIQVGLPEQLPFLQADGLLANILANPLLALVTTFANHLRTGAPLVLSGILPAQSATLLAAYAPHFALTETLEHEGWLRIVASRI